MLIAKFDNNVEVHQVNSTGFAILVDGIEVLDRTAFEDHDTNYKHAMYDAKNLSEDLGKGTYARVGNHIELAY